ncbi:hypothetical protein, partial [Streptomyces sp. NPDC001250]|uniref:hypothetical protein n=1 Tax=Streptomyces sp. NPDC001250 TaxID=3154382 RepID=UPI00331BBF2D
TAEDGGLPPSAVAVVSPYDPTARYARRGHITRTSTGSPGRGLGGPPETEPTAKIPDRVRT